MALRYRPPSDPTARQGQGDDLASCAASRLLRRELQQYCDGELGGRSVLVAGLRGAGKTWLVEGALKQLIWRSRHGPKPRLRPLLVRLQGPQVFDVLKDEPADPSPPSGGSSGVAGQVAAESSAVVNMHLERGSRHIAAVDGAPPDSEEVRKRELRSRRERKRRLQKALFRQMLELVVLALHSALSRELVFCFRQMARQAGRPSSHGDPGWHEVASAIEISLPEGPPPAEMRGFWQQIGRLDRGVLFPLREENGAGMKELAALSGISYAYKRVAGELKKTNAERLNSTTTGVDAPTKADTVPALLEAFKPLASLLAGATVTASTTSKGIGFALLMGVLATVFAQAVFRYSTTNVRTDVDTRDETFIPTTHADTLERVLPDLVARLLDAGLAPVIVIDELDKVDDLWKKLERYEVLDQFKKLFAERVFTCLLVNRDFIERLNLKSEQEPYARFHSYFTHRAYVSFEPGELHDYLERLIEPVHD